MASTHPVARRKTEDVLVILLWGSKFHVDLAYSFSLIMLSFTQVLYFFRPIYVYGPGLTQG